MKMLNLPNILGQLLDSLTRYYVDGEYCGEVFLYHSGAIVTCAVFRRQNHLSDINSLVTTSSSASATCLQVSAAIGHQGERKG